MVTQHLIMHEVNFTNNQFKIVTNLYTTKKGLTVNVHVGIACLKDRLLEFTEYQYLTIII